MSDHQQYSLAFDDVVKNIDAKLNFDEIYESETNYALKKRQGPCPFCGSGTGSHKGSDGAFTFYPSYNLGKCYSCGTSSGIVKLVKHVHNIEFKDAIHYIASQYFNTVLEDPSLPPGSIKTIQPKKQVTITQRNHVTVEQQKAEEQERKEKFEYILNKIISVKDKSEAGAYIVSRGLDLEKLPVDSYHQAAPYNNLPGGVVFFDSEMRCLNKRYLTDNLPDGVKKAFTFGEMLNSVFDHTFRPEADTVYITEGVINALSLYLHGKSAIALFATTNYISDVKKFKPYFHEKNVVIAFDSDKAGQQSAIKQANFILGNFAVKYLSIIVFPDNLDANDLLRKKSLKQFLGISYYYAHITKELIDSELQKITDDQKNYFPKLLSGNYYNRPSVDEEIDGTFKPQKVEQVPSEVIELFRGTNLLTNEIFVKYEITYLEEYTSFEKKTAHVHKSIEGKPIFIINIAGKCAIIWRPFSQKPYSEFEARGCRLDDLKLFGLKQIGDAYDIMENDEDNSSMKLERATIVYNLVDFLNLAAIDENPVYNFNDKLHWDDIEDLQGYVEDIYQVPTLLKQDQAKARKTGLKFIDIRTFIVPQFNGTPYKNVTEFLKQHQEPRIYKKQLNTALPYKFWDWDKKTNNYDLNVIKLRNFLNANGYFTYKNLQEKEGYMYIKVQGRIVNRMDKDTFPRYIGTYIDDYLKHRGEKVELRNKVSISSRFSENNLSGLAEVQLDFQNSGKDFQNWFFKDGTMWTVTLNGIQKHSQRDLMKYVWDDELLDFPSYVKNSPFKIFFQQGYLNELGELDKIKKSDPLYYHKKMSIYGIKATEKYDIEILDRNNYFLQFLFLTSNVYYEKIERAGIEIKPDDFWYNLTHVLTNDEIMEIKLHLINKLTWLGYMMKDYKSMSDDYGLAILDAIDNEDGLRKKGAAGGGKSIITKAIKQVKRTLILKAEKEDWCEDKHRYENFNGERVIVADDMHLASRIGNMLTDFSEGIEVNPKHKRPRKIPFTESPKIIVTRNYIDDEGERVDRRLGRMFVFPFFHDNKGGRHKERRRPSDYFGRMLFQDDTDEQKSQLVNLFAYCYMANLKYGEVNPPMLDMEKFRLMKRIGEPLIEFLDLMFEDPANFGYIDRVPLFNQFKEQMRTSMSTYQRTHVYSSSQKFKNLVEYYCQLRNYQFNPDQEINDKKQNRVMRQSTTQTNKHGQYISSEHFYIWPKEGNMPEQQQIEENNMPFQQNIEFDDNMPF